MVGLGGGGWLWFVSGSNLGLVRGLLRGLIIGLWFVGGFGHDVCRWVYGLLQTWCFLGLGVVYYCGSWCDYGWLAVVPRCVLLLLGGGCNCVI